MAHVTAQCWEKPCLQRVSRGKRVLRYGRPRIARKKELSEIVTRKELPPHMQMKSVPIMQVARQVCLYTILPCEALTTACAYATFEDADHLATVLRRSVVGLAYGTPANRWQIRKYPTAVTPPLIAR